MDQNHLVILGTSDSCWDVIPSLDVAVGDSVDMAMVLGHVTNRRSPLQDA